MGTSLKGEITRLLNGARGGRSGDRERLASLVHAELRKIAARRWNPSGPVIPCKPPRWRTTPIWVWYPKPTGSGRTGRQSSPSRIMAASGYARKATSCRLVQTPDHARSQCGRDALPGPNPDFSSPFNRHCASCSWRSLLGCRLGTRAETCCGSGSRSMRRLESRRGRLKSLRHKATRKVR
jgi:hypothetical protein